MIYVLCRLAHLVRIEHFKPLQTTLCLKSYGTWRDFVLKAKPDKHAYVLYNFELLRSSFFQVDVT